VATPPHAVQTTRVNPHFRSACRSSNSPASEGSAHLFGSTSIFLALQLGKTLGFLLLLVTGRPVLYIAFNACVLAGKIGLVGKKTTKLIFLMS